MLNVNIYTNAFQHTLEIIGELTSTYYTPPSRLKWLNRLPEYGGITVFVDDFIFSSEVDTVKTKTKIAWLLEPSVFSDFYERIKIIEDKFDYILTYDEGLLARSPKYLKYIVGQTRVSDEVANVIPVKIENVSMIASNKRISAGHRYRHELINAIVGYDVELWGSGYRGFDQKYAPLAPYKYSIAVMNSKINNFFTEVLIDCFRLRTVPIFWGCPNIDNYFDTTGMIIFDTPEDLKSILSNLPPYSTFEDAIERNFELCKKYLHTDDYIADVLEKL